MKAKDIMTPQIEGILSEDTIRQAADKMKELDVGVLPVISAGDVIGIITDRDIVIRSVAPGFDPNTQKVIDAATQDTISCKEEDKIETVAELMEKKQIRRILVRNEADKVTGIVSLGDLALWVEKEKSGEVLQKVSEPAQPARKR